PGWKPGGRHGRAGYGTAPGATRTAGARTKGTGCARESELLRLGLLGLGVTAHGLHSAHRVIEVGERRRADRGDPLVTALVVELHGRGSAGLHRDDGPVIGQLGKSQVHEVLHTVELRVLFAGQAGHGRPFERAAYNGVGVERAEGAGGWSPLPRLGECTVSGWGARGATR